MRSFALSAVGADRPGIIAAIADCLVAHGLNVTDSQMGILRGYFATMLVLEAETVDEERLRADLAAVAERLELEALTFNEVHEAGHAPGSATHVVSVYGADHPGILASITNGLAAAGVNVCNLRTRLVEADAVYVMIVDVALPGELQSEALEAALAAIGEQQGVDVSFRVADADDL